MTTREKTVKPTMRGISLPIMPSRYLQEKGGVGERNPGRPGILEVQVRLCLSTHMFLAFAPPECGAGQAGIISRERQG